MSELVRLAQGRAQGDFAPMPVPAPTPQAINGPLRQHGDEHACLWLLDRAGTLLLSLRLPGTRNSTPIRRQEIARMIVQSGASHLVLTHWHPSGDPHPSAADVEATRQLWRMTRALDARLIDHIIFAWPGGRFSFRENGLM